MDKKQDQPGKNAQVIDLQKAKYRIMVLDAFDRLERQEKRQRAEHRADVERKARQRW